MSIPKAVSPSALTPGLYLLVNLLAGPTQPGGGVLRVALISPKSSAGDLTVDTEIRAGAGSDSASTAFGPGTIGHLAAKQIYTLAPTAQVDFAAPTAGAGSAVRTVAFTGSPAANNTVICDIGPVTFELGWLAGETNNDIRQKLIDRVAELTSDLPISAAAGVGAGQVDLTFKVAGNVGNDLLVRFRLKDPQTGTEAVDTNTPTNLVGGTTDADPQTVLDNLGKEYHFILFCTSNADAVATGGSEGPAKVLTHINANNTGISARLQQAVFASTTTLAAAKTAAIARNDGVATHCLCINGRGLPCELAAREVGGRLAALALSPNPNRIGELITSYVGAFDVNTDKPTPAEVEDALGNGVSIVDYDASNRPIFVRPITTYSQDSSGGSDRRLLDNNIVDAVYIMSRDLRSYLSSTFSGAKISKDTVAGEEPPPEGVVEERDILTSLIGRLNFWVRETVLDRNALEASVAAGEVIVQVDPADDTQVNVVVPAKIVPNLAKLGVVVERQSV